jgi:hypothetical protein
MVHDSDGRNPTKLRSYSHIYRHLARCGAGQVGYCAADPKHGSHVARTDIRTGSTVALTDGPSDSDPACTADGSALVFFHGADHDNRGFIIRKSLDSGQSDIFYEFSSASEAQAARTPILSPDGTPGLLAATRCQESLRMGEGHPDHWRKANEADNVII